MADWRGVSATYARRYGIDPRIFQRQINQESGFNPNARSPAGALGIAQIVPRWHPDVNPNMPGNQRAGTNPHWDLEYAARWMGQLNKKYGNMRDALSVYNSGRPWAKGQRISETNNYVNRILAGSSPAANPPRSSASPAPVKGESFEAVDDSAKRNALLGFVMANNASFAATGRMDPGASLGALLQAYQSQPSPEAMPVPRQPGEVTPEVSISPSKGGKMLPWQKMVAAIRHAQSMGLRVGENPFVDPVDPVHTKTSYHYRTFPGNSKVGRGADISGDPDKMVAFAKWFLGRFGGGAELFHDPLGGWKNGRSIGAIGGHGKHVHIAF